MSKRKLLLFNKSSSALHVEYKDLEANIVKKLKIKKIKILSLEEGKHDLLLYYCNRSILLNTWPNRNMNVRNICAPCDGAFSANLCRIESPGIPISVIAQGTVTVADIITNPSMI
ncbi:MAG TPA: hypothetical protein VJ951_06480 [Bacteroidales bacterium]|nr:hypothetical protein [Bacteroidales bacterium]